MKKAIVTGATGFIGKFLVKELIKHNIDTIAVIRDTSQNLTVFDSGSVKVVKCNLENYSTLPQLISDQNIDAVFHTAWQGISDLDAKRSEIQLLNIKATLDLIDVAHEMKAKTFIGCGSIHEAESILEMSKDKVITNLGYMYKSAKIAAHWMGKAKAGNYGIRFFWPLINTYGEGEKSSRLVNSVIRKILNGETPYLSSGEQYYDFVHVSDVAYALYLIADKGIDGTNYTIGSGDAKPLKEFLNIIGKISNSYRKEAAVPLGFGKITNSVISLPVKTFDITNLQRDTGFKPRISFEDGIKQTVQWIQMQSDFQSGDNK